LSSANLIAEANYAMEGAVDLPTKVVNKVTPGREGGFWNRQSKDAEEFGFVKALDPAI